MPSRPAHAIPSRVLVLASDPAVIAVARDAAQRVRRSAQLVQSCRQALAVLAAPGRVRHQLVCDRGAAEAECWPDIVAAAVEQRTLAPLLVVSDVAPRRLPVGIRTLPTSVDQVAQALSADPAAGDAVRLEGASLRCGLGRGEIVVRYQPIVRVADRRPVMVEALARWTPGYPPIGPDRFLPLAAQHGLMLPLSKAVTRAAIRDIGPLQQTLRIGITLNLPLDVLQRGDLRGWLRAALACSALRPEHVSIELTEHAEVLDRIAVGRALSGLRQAGHGVFLDDVQRDDPRAALFQLPFAGLKLDRCWTSELASSARARETARRLARQALARGQTLVAEGVSDPMQLQLLRDLGIPLAQGFLIGRPLPARALRGWSELWRAGRPL